MSSLFSNVRFKQRKYFSFVLIFLGDILSHVSACFGSEWKLLTVRWFEAARARSATVHQTVQPVIFNLIPRTDIPILQFSYSRRRFALSSVGRRPKRHTKTLGRDRFWVQSLSALRPSARPLLQPVVTCWLRTVTTHYLRKSAEAYTWYLPFTGYPPTLVSGLRLKVKTAI